MIKEVCLDTNILIPWIAPDEPTMGQDVILEEFRSKSAGILWAPAHVSFEILSVLGRKVKAGLITQQEADYGLEMFYELPLVLVWNRDLAINSLEVQSHGLAAYDAAFLALAMMKECSLVTQDQELLKRGRKIYKSVFSLEEWLQ